MVWWLLQRRPSRASVSDPRFPQAWCFLALLLAASMSDNIIHPEEEIEIDALAVRTRTLAALTQEEMDRFFGEHREILDRQNSVYALADLACEKLSAGEGAEEAIFAQCVDIVLADRVLVPEESQFLQHIADALGISRRSRDEIMRVITWKNSF